MSAGHPKRPAAPRTRASRWGRQFGYHQVSNQAP